MKAGTAQKLVLNAFSTAVMVRLGRTYSNLMADVLASNAKLRGRVITVLVEATGKDDQTCAAALSEAEGVASVALVSLLTDTSVTRAAQAVAATDGAVRKAMALIEGAPHPS